MEKVKVKANTNIAVVKYWGKHEIWEKWHIPNKSSASFSTANLFTETEMKVEEGKGEVEFELNGEFIRKEDEAYKYVGKYFGKLFELVPNLKHYNFYIKSKNNFPTAAGFASSASGFAAMAKAIQGIVKKVDEKAYNEYFKGDLKLSVFARLGSGSATRGIPEQGGFVVWHRGISPDFKIPPELLTKESKNKIIFSSYAESLFPPEHWEDLRMVYVSVKKSEKKIKSRAGMKMSVKTTPIYYNWVEYEEKVVLPKMIEAIKNKDFDTFASLVMQCSNGLHAIAYYTQPRIRYLNDVSEQIIETILNLNEKETKAAYTFDAGPNAVVFTLRDYVDEVVSSIADIVNKENIFVTKPGKGAVLIE